MRKSHLCHWPGCKEEVPPSLWGCLIHWMKLPRYLRRKISRACRPGQEIDKKPSAEYVKTAREVQDWISNSKTAQQPPAEPSASGQNEGGIDAV